MKLQIARQCSLRLGIWSNEMFQQNLSCFCPCHFLIETLEQLRSNFNVLFSFRCSASEWKVPTTFIYGYDDWMNYQGAQEARKSMKVPCEIIRVPQVFHSHPLPCYTYRSPLSTPKNRCCFYATRLVPNENIIGKFLGYDCRVVISCS